MLREQGTVRSTRESKALVVTHRGSACEACKAQGACRALGGAGREMIVEAINEAGASEGDRVELSIEESSLLKASFLVYFIPVVMLLLGAALGKALAGPLGIHQDLSSVLFAALLFGMTWAVVRVLGRNLGARKAYFPVVTRILSDDEPKCEEDGSVPAPGYGG